MFAYPLTDGRELPEGHHTHVLLFSEPRGRVPHAGPYSRQHPIENIVQLDKLGRGSILSMVAEAYLTYILYRDYEYWT